jgi:hypothetical protein
MSTQISVENLLISALSREARREILPDLFPVYVHQHTAVTPASQESDVIFPLTCVLSLMTQTGDGQSVENVAIGYEGATLFRATPLMRVSAQLGGEALRMPRSAFACHLANEEFRCVMDDYRDRLLATACQATVCQAFHTAEQRLAQWLLVICDRARSFDLSLTQDLLATMMGVQRPTVTIAARILQAADLISYRYGRVTIRDHRGLQDAACDCYRQMALRGQTEDD